MLFRKRNKKQHYILLLIIALLVCIIPTITAIANVSSYSRVAYQDLDILWDDDLEAREWNMDRAVEHLQNLGVNTVFIQAYRDAVGYTRVEKMYFPNTPLGDYRNGNAFTTFATKCAKAGIKAGAWMPITAFQFTTINNKPAEYVLTWDPEQQKAIQTPCDASSYYCRLTPFNNDNFDIIYDIYKSLLLAYPDLYIINGHDDGAMNDKEDCSQSALAAYKAAGFSDDCATLMKYDEAQATKWAQFKSQKISQFFGDLIRKLHHEFPERGPNGKNRLYSSRNVYVNSIIEYDSNSIRWFAQDPYSVLNNTDYIAPMVMPYMEQITPQPQDSSSSSSSSTTTTDFNNKQFNFYFANFIEIYKQFDPELAQLQLCLQSVNWRIVNDGEYQAVTSGEFEEWIRYGLKDLGIFHLGWYPTNHYQNQPMATTNIKSLLAYENPNPPALPDPYVDPNENVAFSLALHNNLVVYMCIATCISSLVVYFI